LSSGSAIARSREPKAFASSAAQRLDEVPDVSERHRSDLRDVFAPELHGQRFGAEALAVASVAGAGDEETPQLVVGDPSLAGLRVLGVGGFDAYVGQGGQAPFEPRHDAFVAFALGALPLAVLARGTRRTFTRSAALAEEDRLALLFRQLAPRGVRVHAQSLDGGGDLARQRDAAAAAPCEDDALAQRMPRVAHAALRVDDVARAETVARGASAVRSIEREHPRLDGRE